MDRDSIHTVVSSVFHKTPHDQSGWVSLSCPFAKWRHTSGVDRRISAGISVHDDAASIFNCYSCKTKLPLSVAVYEWGVFSGLDLSSVVREIDDSEFFIGKAPEWGAGVKTIEYYFDTPPLEESQYLGIYPEGSDHPYIRERGVSSETAKFLGLRIDPSDSIGEERILFPVYDHFGGFRGMTGRSTDPNTRLKSRDYHGLQKHRCLYGIQHLKGDTGVCLVEGPFDCAVLWDSGVPSVAALHSDLTDAQTSVLLDLASPVYLFLDNDSAGLTGRNSITKKLKKYVPVWWVEYPDKRIKDPGELCNEAIREAIDNANPAPL